MLKLKLFGAPAVERDGEEVATRAAQGHRIALLAFLALQDGRNVSRDKLIALLWPDHPTDRARHQLSDTLYLIRSGLGAELIENVGDDVAMNLDVVTSDVGEFESLIGRGDLEQAVALHTAPLLDGFHIAGSVEFERWLEASRDRLSDLQARSLAQLAERHEQSGDITLAIVWWRRLAALDPCDGRVAMRLMRALDTSGDRAGALRHARVHATMLRSELDAEPDAELLEYEAQLRKAPVTRAPDPKEPAADVDHEAESTDAQVEPVPARAGNSLQVERRRSNYRRFALAATAILVVAGIAHSSGLVNRSSVGGAAANASVVQAPAARSLAVLPFVNMTPHAENDYFSDGLSEQIITALSRVTGLRVAARTSSFALRGTRLDARKIGDTLNVEALLEGSVRSDGKRLRVTAQLIDATTGYHIWSGEYDREVTEVIAVQEEIARAIAAALELRLPVRVAAGTQKSPPSFEAYDYYLRALHLRNELNADALRNATELLDHALAVEPAFALAHAARASVIAPRIYFNQMPLDAGIRDMRTSLERAFAIDSTLGEAYVSLGILRLFFEWDWPAAERALQRAVALNPNDAHAWHHLANYHHAMGNAPAAVDARKRGVALDPLNPRTRIVLATDFLQAGLMDEAFVELDRAERLDPMNPLLLGLGPTLPPLVRAHLRAGNADATMQALLRVAALRNFSVEEMQRVRAAWQRSGASGMWREWLKLEEQQFGRSLSPMRAALIYMCAGDANRALDMLEVAYRQREPGLIYMNSDNLLEPLHSHERFRKLARAMRF